MSTRVTLKNVEIRSGSWRNFAGEKTDFNDAGKRNFCAFLSQAQADELISYGVNVKTRAPREDGDEPLYYVKVNVNLNSKWPPKIYICTRGEDGSINETQLSDNDVASLDNLDIQSANLILNLNETDNPRFGHTVTAYLNAGAFMISDSDSGDLFDWR